MTVTLLPGTAGRAHRALDTLHALVYFVPEAEQEFTAIGLKRGRMGYFASRAAAMGPVGAGVVTATFYNFNPAVVARFVPQAWTLASPAEALAARLRVADRSLRRLLGEDVVAGPEVAEAAELARAATGTLQAQGRPLYAGHADLPWPEEPHLVLWHAITLLREHRGDGHTAVLLAAGVSGLEALVTHTATGRGFSETAAQATRGWSADDWAEAVTALTGRGLLDDGGLTPAGVELRERVEAETDALSLDPWVSLGPDRTDRLIELGRGLSRRAVAAGAFPPGLWGARR